MSSPSEETDLDLFDGVDEKSLAGADFTAEVIGELRRAFNGLRESSDLTQKAVADRLGVSKSAVHRWLYGDGNMTVRKLGELVWAMRCRSTLKITPDLDYDVCEGEANACAPAPVVYIPELVAEPDATTGQYFRLTPITIADAKATRLTGEQLHLSGQLGGAAFRGLIMAAGQNVAIAQFQGIHGGDAVVLGRSLADRCEGATIANGSQQPALTGQRGTMSTRGIDLLGKGKCMSVGAMA